MYEPTRYRNYDSMAKDGCGIICAIAILLLFARGLFGFAATVYEERQLLPTPVTGTIVSYEIARGYVGVIKDIVVDFDYKGKTYTLDSREQVVFTSKKLHHGFSEDYSTITVYVNPEDPQKSRVERRKAGWYSLLVICIAGTVWLGVVIFLVIRIVRLRRFYNS